jgi:putative SOS response-associated peptidase YedK
MRSPTAYGVQDDAGHRRCVIPAERFYKWREELDQKHLFARKDGQPLMFAGI